MMVKIPITEADAIRALACKVKYSCSCTCSSEIDNGVLDQLADLLQCWPVACTISAAVSYLKKNALYIIVINYYYL